MTSGTGPSTINQPTLPAGYKTFILVLSQLTTDTHTTKKTYTHTMIEDSLAGLEITAEKHEVKEEKKTEVGLNVEGSELDKKDGVKKEKKKKMKMSTKYNDDDADLTIISSDGFCFRVHSIIILRAS
jgi:hypothetical protein